MDELILCPNCGNEAEVISHFIKGIANKVHHFVKCKSCKLRTRDRKTRIGAIADWNLQPQKWTYS
jgi:uncharacterized Zn finger protein